MCPIKRRRTPLLRLKTNLKDNIMYTLRGYAALVIVPIIENFLNGEGGFCHIRMADEDKWGLIELHEYFSSGLFIAKIFQQKMRELIEYFTAFALWEYDEILELEIYDELIEVELRRDEEEREYNKRHGL